MASLPRIDDLGPGSDALNCGMSADAGPAFVIAWLMRHWREQRAERKHATQPH